MASIGAWFIVPLLREPQVQLDELFALLSVVFTTVHFFVSMVTWNSTGIGISSFKR